MGPCGLPDGADPFNSLHADTRGSLADCRCREIDGDTWGGLDVNADGSSSGPMATQPRSIYNALTAHPVIHFVSQPYSMSAPLRRVVTGHKDGKSMVLIEDRLEPLPGFAANAVTIWQNHRYLAELADHDAAASGGTKIYTKGSLIRVVDFPANSTGHNHRTKSLDYGIVMDGEIDLVLENGSTTTVRAGDVVVQQAVSSSFSPYDSLRAYYW